MFKGYRLASPGAIVALISFFLPWFVLSGCQGNTSVSGIDAVKLMADSNTAFLDKLKLSGPGLLIPLLAIFVLFMAVWARGRGRISKRDIISVTGAGVLLTLILAWYLLLLRDAIVEIRYGFWGEMFAAAFLLMGGLLNLRVYGLNHDAEETALPVAPSAWRWTVGAILLTGLCAFTTYIFLPDPPETTIPAFTPSNTTQTPSFAPTTTPVQPPATATTSAEVIGEPIQYLQGQVDCYDSFAWVVNGDLTNSSPYPIEATIYLSVDKSESFYSESATEYFVIQPGTTEPIFFSGPDVTNDPFVEYSCSVSVSAQWANK